MYEIPPAPAGANALSGTGAIHRYIVRRTFAPGVLASVDAAAKAKVNANNAKYGVTWVVSFANEDMTRTWCVYDGPSEAAIRAEIKVRLQEALNSMDALDREVLALRHFEHLTSAETAEVLGIKEKAAAMRYVRALRRLKDILTNLPGGLGEFGP